MEIMRALASVLLLMVIVTASQAEQGRSSSSADAPSRPLIFVPGIMGSKLCERGTRQIVWGDRYSYTRARINRLRLSAPAEGTQSELEPCGVIFEVSIIPLLYTESYYKYAKDLFEIKMNYKIGENLFYFDYDWRADSVENSRRLAQAVQSIKRSTGAAKVDLLAHSMGGLIAARYVMDGSNHENVGKIITVATPFWGSATILQRLYDGVPNGPKQGSQAFEDMRSAILSFPSTYELLPSYRNCCWSDNGADYFDIFRTGALAALPWFQTSLSWRGARAATWLDERLTTASATKALMVSFLKTYHERAAEPKLFIAASSRFDTVSRLRIDPTSGRIGTPIGFPGDGVVLLSSAVGASVPVPDQFADEQHDVIFKSESLRSWLQNLLIANRILNSSPNSKTLIEDAARNKSNELQSVGVSLERNIVIASERINVMFSLVSESPLQDEVADNLQIVLLDVESDVAIKLPARLEKGRSQYALQLHSDFTAPAQPGTYRIVLVNGDQKRQIGGEWIRVIGND